MRAVSNTTPLRYLIAIQQDQLLADLFEKVFIPAAVRDELTDPGTPEIVRDRIRSLPHWLEVRVVAEILDSGVPRTLHNGEREAILLAEELRADVLLLDERSGRGIALDRKLPVSGTLGVLERADQLGLVADFAGVLWQLKASGFFITRVLEQQLLERHRERQQR